jgi:hypothetical protein
MLVDEILTYVYVKPRDQGFLTERPPDQPFQDRLGAQSLYPSGTLARTLRPKKLAELERNRRHHSGLGGSTKP